MKFTISLADKKIYDFAISAEKALKSRERQIGNYIQGDKGLLEQDKRVLAQMIEQSGPKAEVGALILCNPKKNPPRTLSDKFYKNWRQIQLDDMEKVLAEVEEITGKNLLLVSPNWLGDGRVGIGKYGSSACATDGSEPGSIRTYLKLTGLTSRLNAHHWVQGHKSPEGQDKFPVLVVIDEESKYITPTGEILVSDKISKQEIIVREKPADGIPAEDVKRTFNAGRIVDNAGLKGVTIPCKSLGHIEFEGQSYPVDAVVGINSVKGGLASAKVWGHQFRTGTEFKLEKDLPQEILTGEWHIDNGRKVNVKFGISYVILTELADQFDKVSVHRMATEVVRTMDLQGNSALVDSLLRKTDTSLDLVFRKMLGEIPNDEPAWQTPVYDSTKPWNVTSKVTNWDRTPFPDTFRNMADHYGRLVPSKEFIKSHSILIEEGIGENQKGASWIMPAWATAWAGYLVSVQSGRQPNDERLNNALYSVIDGKRGSTRTSLRPRVTCLQGKQVGCREMSPGKIGTTKMTLWGRGGITIRYPVLWNQISKSEIESAPERIGPFRIDHSLCKGLIFRNLDDMYWEQSDSDGDTSFTYILSDKDYLSVVEYKGEAAVAAYNDYKTKEESSVLKDLEVQEYKYVNELRSELLTASQNKVRLGTATIDLWRIADGFYGNIPNLDLIELVDTLAYYVQDTIMRGIKHETSRGKSYDAIAYLATTEIGKKYLEGVVELMTAELIYIMEGMGQSYVTLEALRMSNGTWIGKWISRVYSQDQTTLMLKDIIDHLLNQEATEERRMIAAAELAD